MMMMMKSSITLTMSLRTANNEMVDGYHHLKDLDNFKTFITSFSMMFMWFLT